MTTEKFCRDCIHSGKQWGLGWSVDFPFIFTKTVTEQSKCLYFKTYNKVTGADETVLNSLFCTGSREYSCGRDAKYFEPLTEHKNSS